ncbi:MULTISPECIES: hypothetical protein [unclassified Clostridium]|uniref:hypothetical protein n=1 Tax=unclassified Clostridium TaxID=2614128 RepID=UPI0002985087|nr:MULTISPECIES: hypothetical protein [unclassified Clostridium]EKQ51889.1 MAG: hypothetical protein A370_04505 [Clostridium sp. Maddingley MBC34-26]
MGTIVSILVFVGVMLAMHKLGLGCCGGHSHHSDNNTNNSKKDCCSSKNKNL